MAWRFGIVLFWGVGLMFNSGLVYSSGAFGSALEREISRIKGLLSAGDASAAMARAEAAEWDYAGEPVFDFYYGLAAVETGQPAMGIMAFERILYDAPKSPRVRLELGRALYLTEDYPAAEQQFQQVLALSPPATVQTRVNQYLQAIAQQQQALNLNWSGFAGFASGYDSNINSATSAEQFDFALGTVFFSEESRKTSGAYSQTSGGVSFNRPISERLTQYGSASLQSSDNWDLSDFDSDALSLSMGGMLKQDGVVWRLPVSLQTVYIDGDPRRYSASIGLDQVVSLTTLTQWLNFSQINMVRNPQNGVRDTNLFLLGTGITHVLPQARTQLMASLSIGHDRPLGDAVFGKVFVGLRAGAEVRLSPLITSFLNANVQQVKYEGQGSFLEKRSEVFSQAATGFNWQMAPDWSSTFNVSYTDNHSNVVLYDYDRTQATFSVRWQWK